MQNYKLRINHFNILQIFIKRAEMLREFPKWHINTRTIDIQYPIWYDVKEDDVKLVFS